MWNDEAILITKVYETDDYGNQVPIRDKELTVLCKSKSITRREYYDAQKVGLKPAIIIIVKNYEYSEQSEIIFKDKRYKVDRTYSDRFEEIELTCSRIER